MAIGLLTLHIIIPGCSSLKEKRGRIKPILSRLHRQFNVSVAEIEYHDIWQSTIIGCVILSNDPDFTRCSLQQVIQWVETNCPDLNIVEEKIEII